jgi:hypothetical protein
MKEFKINLLCNSVISPKTKVPLAYRKQNIGYVEAFKDKEHKLCI